MMFSLSSFFSAFAKDLRIGQRLIVETFGGFKRSGWMNLIILVTMTSILSIFGSLTLLILDSQHLVDQWGSRVAISVYLENEATLADMEPELRSHNFRIHRRSSPTETLPRPLKQAHYV